MNVLDLIAIKVHPTQAKAFAPHLDAAFERFRIITLDQRAGFLAQCMHESTSFTRLEEDLYYRSATRLMQLWPTRFFTITQAEAVLRKPELLANTVYNGINGNGDRESGDGWRYRGRGLLQLTGRANYAQAAADSGRDYVEHPELVAQPADATLTAAWFWNSRGCNELMASGQFDKTTRRINKALAGFGERRGFYFEIKAVLEAQR